MASPLPPPRFGFLAKLLTAVVLAWIALLPPLFTRGACTAEFQEESAHIDRDMASLRTSASADAYWRERAVPHVALSVDQCRKAKPRNLASCGSGPTLIAKVPVKDAICRIYRDDEIRVTLQYNERDRLSNFRMDMSPYKSFPVPFTKILVHWGR